MINNLTKTQKNTIIESLLNQSMNKQEELFETIVPEFLDKLTEKYKKYDLYLAMSYSFSRRGLEISHIILPEIHRNKGIGTKIMNEICQFSDQNGISIYLSPTEIDSTPTDILMKFYKKFGFNFLGGSKFMVRKPKNSMHQSTDQQTSIDLLTRDFMEELESQFDIDLWLDYDPYVNALVLAKIVVDKDKRNESIGTKTMDKICDFADKHELKIYLTPSVDFGGNLSRLKSFYKGFGFVNYKGYRIRQSMVREPK